MNWSIFSWSLEFNAVRYTMYAFSSNTQRSWLGIHTETYYLYIWSWYTDNFMHHKEQLMINKHHASQFARKHFKKKSLMYLDCLNKLNSVFIDEMPLAGVRSFAMGSNLYEPTKNVSICVMISERRCLNLSEYGLDRHMIKESFFGGCNEAMSFYDTLTTQCAHRLSEREISGPQIVSAPSGLVHQLHAVL